MRIRRLYQATISALAAMLFVMGLAWLPGSGAGAANHCGSWKAGEHTTYSQSGASFVVRGDTENSTSWVYQAVQPGKTANYYGVCDADHVANNGSWLKISYEHSKCIWYLNASPHGQCTITAW